MKSCKIIVFVIIVLFLCENLFGFAGFSFGKPAFPLGQSDSLPPLSLVGVIVSQDASSSIAILKNEQTDQTTMLRTGERILDFTLSQVLDNHIVLKRGDLTYKIYLGRGRIARAVEPARETPEAPPPVPEKEPAEKPGESSDVIRMEFNRAEMERRLQTELPLIMQDARFVPNMVNGRVSGFRITRLPEQSIISQIGIRRNDIIKTINDVELNSVEGMLDLYMRFQNESRFEVTIERSGKTLRLLYILK